MTRYLDQTGDCDSGRNSFNRPFIFANRNNREATGLRAAPTRAKALRIKPPRASALSAGFCERLPGHLSVRREGHFEFNATECGSGEGVAVEECCLDVAWSHGLRSEGSARVEKYCCNNEWLCAHRTSGGWPTLKNPVWLIYTQSRGSSAVDKGFLRPVAPALPSAPRRAFSGQQSTPTSKKNLVAEAPLYLFLFGLETSPAQKITSCGKPRVSYTA